MFDLCRVQSNRFLTFQSLSGSISDQVTLPLTSLYLHTSYFRVHTGFEINEGDRKFGAIAWEVFNILKENFPSKIYLSQENLEQCKPEYQTMTLSEELRRQISCLMSIKEEDRSLTQDELEDAWFTLQFSEKVNDQRSLNTCLELINAQVGNWAIAKQVIDIETLQRIINKNDYSSLTSNKILAQELIGKMQTASIDSQQRGQDKLGDTFQRESLESQNEETISLVSENNTINETQSLNHYEKPTSTRMCLFQLSESNDINRVTMILETLSLKSKETLAQLRKKYNLNTKLLNILKKYCNAEYGFEQLSSRHGSFQFNLLKLLIILSQDYVAFLENLQSQTIDYLSQIIEEGIIYAYEDAISGATTNHYSLSSKQSQVTSFNQDLYKFLLLSLDFIELAISKNYQEFLPSIRESLRKIQARLVKLVQKKENAVLSFFIRNYQSQESNVIPQITEEQQESTFNVDQLIDLKSISPQLYHFATELQSKSLKVEVLIDIQEDHEEKFMRLFYKFIAQNQRKVEVDPAKFKNYQQQDLKDVGRTNLGRVKFDLNQDKNFGSHRAHVVNQDKHQESYQTYDYKRVPQKENLYIRNNLDDKQMKRKDSFKQEVSKHQEKGQHFIGSPIKAQQFKLYDRNDRTTKEPRSGYYNMI